MRTEYLGCYSVPDGYFGDRAICHFCFDPETGRTLAVHLFGFHASEVPPAVSAVEARWLITYHPICKGRIKEVQS